MQLGAAGEQWIRLSTTHFEMYTTDGEKRSRETILYFEQIRSFFINAAPVKGATTEFPVRIVAFKSRKQFEPYAPSEAAAAFFVPGRSRDYIVMSDLESEHLPATIHEYTHLLIHHTGMKLPLWLNEGLADVYSTLKPSGKKALVGDMIPGRVQQLMNEKWLPFDVLTSVGRDSPIYNEKVRAGIFYSESWALTHMLYLSPAYGPNFPKFVALVAGGATTPDACKTAFNKSGAQVYKDLQTYLKSDRLFGALFDVKLSKSEEEAELFKPEEFDSSLVSADLLATLNKQDRARAEYASLIAKFPDRHELYHSVGYLAWQHGDDEEARLNFEKAFDKGNNDPQMCYHLGIMERNVHKTKERAIPAFLRAVSLLPDYTDARMELGNAELELGDFKAAIYTLAQVKNINSERASRLFNALAYAYTQGGNLAEGRKNAELANKWNHTPQERAQTDNLIRFLDSREEALRNAEKYKVATEAANEHTAHQAAASNDLASPNEGPPHQVRMPSITASANPFVEPGEQIKRVEGIARSLNCKDSGTTFTILAGDKLLTFDMSKPDRIQLRHKGETTFDLICGPQKPFSLAVEYVPFEKGALAGALKLLEF